ncbi:hypothetical protein MVEN_02027200 [Mycena venus]|uniref:F-box domain-containing protein n=1 Tax=Mycena venus TaxID=2733690 RepID=A0A8H6XCF6_9AGAR|nr:hypothetical protein MVEN_02027200 [Mycena venus]
MPTVDLRRRLMELEGEIAHQKRVLHDLEQARTATERELLATATFPALSLPPEVTAEVFLHCLPLLRGLGWGVESTGPLILTSVCRAWRDITLATPVLWSSLALRFDDIPYDVVTNPGSMEDFIDRWLSRAGTCPLSLCFRISGDEFTLSVSRLRDIIHRYSHRVQYLEIHAGDDCDIRELRLDSVEFPLLQSAALHCDHDPDPHVDLPGNVFGNAPQFHNLRLLSAGITPTSFTLAWSQLTKFEGTIWDLKLFTFAPNLTEVTCSFDPDDQLFAVITHPCLRSLTIGEDNSDDNDIIQYLDLPGLRHLDVRYMDEYDSLEPFLVRSSPPLVSLSVRGDQSSFSHWRQCMRLVAGTLESLEMHHVSAGVMSSLFGPALSSSCLDALPNIRAISLEGVESVDLPFLVHFLYSRSSKLRTFKLVWASNPFLDGRAWAGPTRRLDTFSGHLTRLGRAGMSIYLGPRDKNYVIVDENENSV